MSITLGSVPYLNEKPLTRWFAHTDEGRNSGIKVIYAVPSALAVMLAAGEIEAALVSSFEYLQTPGYQIVPNVSISTRDEVLSVRAFARLPWRLVQTVALDTSSLTSSALLKVLLADLYHAYPAYIHQPPNLETMLAAADAGLLIGDAGMLAIDEGLYTLDLGAAWRQLTGLPFVYACWIGREDVLTPGLIETLQAAKAWGLTQLEPIAGEQADLLGCPVSLCSRFLSDIMDYDLGEEELAGFQEFGDRCFHHQLLPNRRSLDIAGQHD